MFSVSVSVPLRTLLALTSKFRICKMQFPFVPLACTTFSTTTTTSSSSTDTFSVSTSFSFLFFYFFLFFSVLAIHCQAPRAQTPSSANAPVYIWPLQASTSQSTRAVPTIRSTNAVNRPSLLYTGHPTRLPLWISFSECLIPSLSLLLSSLPISLSLFFTHTQTHPHWHPQRHCNLRRTASLTVERISFFFPPLVQSQSVCIYLSKSNVNNHKQQHTLPHPLTQIQRTHINQIGNIFNFLFATIFV